MPQDPSPTPPAASASASAAPVSAAPLPTARVEAIPHIAFCLCDAAGLVLVARDADRPFYAASTIKLHVLIAALREAASGRLDLSASIPAARRFTGLDGAEFELVGDHQDPTHPEPGTPIPVRDLLVRMIDRSSNEATDAVIQLVGLPAIARTIGRLDLPGTRVERLIGDAAALDAGLTNETTAADLSRTLHLLVRGEIPGLDADGRELALAALRAQQLRVITQEVRAGVDAGSKSGEVDLIRHDVAFLQDPDGPDLRVLAVLTSGIEAAAADETVRALTRALVPDLCAPEAAAPERSGA